MLSNKHKDLLVSILLYLTTLFFAPSFTYLFLFFICYKQILKLNSRDNNYIILLFIIIISYINVFLSFFWKEHFQWSPRMIVPYTVLFLISFGMVKHVNKRVIYYFSILCCIEVFVGLLEYYSGVSSFWGENTFGRYSTKMLYETRVAGLSHGASSFAEKLMLCILSIHYFKVKVSKVIYVLIGSGLVLTFNRSVLVVLALYFFIKYFHNIRDIFFNHKKFSPIKKFLIFLIVIGTPFIAYFIYIKYSDQIIYQLTRGGGDITKSDSSRFHIWGEFFSFIKENLLLGNGSIKYMIQYNDDLAHAHNSYIQTLATNGIIITFFIFYYIFRNINSRNRIYILTIMFFSFLQYGILWGVSFMDVFFYAILMNYSTQSKESSEKI